MIHVRCSGPRTVVSEGPRFLFLFVDLILVLTQPSLGDRRSQSRPSMSLDVWTNLFFDILVRAEDGAVLDENR